MSNICNYEEGCSLPSSSNENEILLRQLKREVSKLIETTEVKLLAQDGKIAETCVYIKNNLSNELRTLLDSMMNSGELESVISETLLNEVELIHAMFPTPAKYGAVCDGVSDDTYAIQKLINENRNVYLPKGKYKVSSLTIPSNTHLHGDGIENTIIEFTGSGLKLGNIANISKFISLNNITFKSNNDIGNIYNTYYVEIKECQFIGNTKNNGLIIDGKDVNVGDSPAYYINIKSSMFSGFDKAIKFMNQANANVVETTSFYNCSRCVEIDNSNGIKLFNNTFQDFKEIGVNLLNTHTSAYNNGSVIIGNYFEASLVNTIKTGVNIDNELVRSTYLMGNKYNNLRGSYPEIIDNGSHTTRLDYTNASPQEVMTLPGFVRFNVKPSNYKTAYNGEKLFGCIQMFSDDKESDVYALNRVGDSYAWSKIPSIKNNVLDLEHAHVRNLTIGQVVPDVSIEGGICYDGYYKTLKYANGSSIKQIQSVNYSNDRRAFEGQGFMMFDTTINKPIWFTGSKWVDANGNEV